MASTLCGMFICNRVIYPSLFLSPHLLCLSISLALSVCLSVVHVHVAFQMPLLLLLLPPVGGLLNFVVSFLFFCRLWGVDDTIDASQQPLLQAVYGGRYERLSLAELAASSSSSSSARSLAPVEIDLRNVHVVGRPRIDVISKLLLLSLRRFFPFSSSFSSSSSSLSTSVRLGLFVFPRPFIGGGGGGTSASSRRSGDVSRAEVDQKKRPTRRFFPLYVWRVCLHFYKK